MEEFVDPCFVLLPASDEVVDDAVEGVAVELGLAGGTGVRERRIHVRG